MKKLFTTIAMAAMAVSAYALSFSGYETDPAVGEVTELSTVTVTFPDVYELEVNSSDDIFVTRDGVQLEGVKAKVPYGTNNLVFTFSTAETTPGTYVFTISEGAIMGYNESYDDYLDLPNEIKLVYTIAGSGGVTFEGYTTDPAEGEVEELSKVTVTFPGVYEAEIANSEDLSVSYNGKVIEGVKTKVTPYGSNNLVFTLPETTKEVGTYVVKIGAGSLTGYSEDYTDYADLNTDIELTYEIKGVADALDFSFVPSLENESVVNSIENISLTFPALDKVVYNGDFTVTVDGVEQSDFLVEPGSAQNVLNVKFSPVLTKEGKVEMTLAAGSLSGQKGETVAVNANAMSLSYTVAALVKHDLTLNFSRPTNPNADGEISANKQIESFFFSAELPGLVASESDVKNVTIREVNGDFTASAHLKKASGLDANLSYFSASFGSEPVYNGEYVITVSGEAFGTELWSTHPEFGRTNGELELWFTLVDGRDHAVYDIEPLSVSPESGDYSSFDDITTFTLTFPAGVEVSADNSASLAAIDGAYVEFGSFVKNNDGSYSVTFNPAPTENGSYRFEVEAGMFGDSAFLANEAGGHGSVNIVVECKVDTLGAVEIVEIEKQPKEVYNLKGVRVSSKLENLPAGIYIVDGKKVAVK